MQANIWQPGQSVIDAFRSKADRNGIWETRSAARTLAEELRRTESHVVHIFSELRRLEVMGNPERLRDDKRKGNIYRWRIDPRVKHVIKDGQGVLRVIR